jgi:hypothetical protein
MIEQATLPCRNRPRRLSRCNKADGIDGANGSSACEVSSTSGYIGTVEQMDASLAWKVQKS